MPTDNGQYHPLAADDAYPTPSMLKSARVANRVATTAGMTSLGLLAMLITHQTLEEKGWPTPGIVAADIVIFLTAISGKVAIMLFFSETPVLEGFKTICHQQWPDYFKITEKNRMQKFQWAINFVLSLNVSLFWSSLAQISFNASGQLLKDFDTENDRFVGGLLQKWYVYLPFVMCSFYANMVAWPSAHSAAYAQKEEGVMWLLSRPWSFDQEKAKADEAHFRVNSAGRELLWEIKGVIEGQAQSPILDQLVGPVELKEGGVPGDFRDITTKKVSKLLDMQPLDLRDLYLSKEVGGYAPVSAPRHVAKHSVALLVSAIAIYGFRNIYGLSAMVSKEWGLQQDARRLLAFLAYYSSSEAVLLTVYPLLCSLFNALEQGSDPYVFSNEKFGLIIAMVFFVGVFGGLANSEQSYLDGESTFDIINSDVAAFLVDSFSIYMIFKSSFESQIKDSSSSDSKTVLSQQFMLLQNLNDRALSHHEAPAAPVLQAGMS